MQKIIYTNSQGQDITLSNSRPFILESIGSTSDVSTDINYSSNPYGVSIDNVSIKEKILPIVGAIVGTDKQDIDRKRNIITKIFNPNFDGELIYENNYNTRRIKCKVQDISFQPILGHFQKFLIQFLCPEGFWKDIYIKKEEVALWKGNFEFDVDLCFEITSEGIEIGNRVSNLICNVVNDGDVECGMKIQFKALATITNPSLLNVNTQDFIKINRTLERGDLLEVTTEFDNKRVELVRSNGVRENVFNWIDLDSEFLQLKEGYNLFRYNAENGIDNLEVSIYYSPLYMGV